MNLVSLLAAVTICGRAQSVCSNLNHLVSVVKREKNQGNVATNVVEDAANPAAFWARLVACAVDDPADGEHQPTKR